MLHEGSATRDSRHKSFFLVPAGVYLLTVAVSLLAVHFGTDGTLLDLLKVATL